MTHSSNQTLAFRNYFLGNEMAYGTTIPGPVDDKGKVQATCKLVHKYPDLATYERHLSGETGIGIAPITEKGKCWFGAIDIDDPNAPIKKIVNAINKNGLPLVPFYSKSHHLHLFIFFKTPIEAADLRSLLKQFLIMFRLPAQTEIFPKQDTISSSRSFYSWINLPCFGDSRGLIDVDGETEVFDMNRVLGEIDSKRKDFGVVQTELEHYPYIDAPPCILSGSIMGDVGPGQRNNWLFSAGVFLRIKDDHCDLEEPLLELNNKLEEPIPESELRDTILSGFEKKTYFYKCAELANICNKAVCKKGTFGIDSTRSAGIEFGNLQQHMSDPPYYVWPINGSPLIFASERDLLSQDSFREQCLRQLHIVPRPLNKGAWSTIVNRACQNIEVIDEPIVGDFSVGARFREVVTKFFTTSRMATDWTQVDIGRLYLDQELNAYAFSASQFDKFLREKNQIKCFNNLEVRTRLKDMGAFYKEPFWYMPADGLPQKGPVTIKFEAQQEEESGF